jgi:hypothetical protein
MTLTSDLPYWEPYIVTTRPHPQHPDHLQAELHVFYPIGHHSAVDQQRDIDHWIERRWGSFNGVRQLSFDTLDELETWLRTLVRSGQ